MDNWRKTFLIIWSGQLLSTLSSNVVGYAVMFWLSIKTGSAEILAFSIIAALLPQLVLGLFTGVFVDRWNRKKTMIISDLLVAFWTLVIAGLLYAGETRIYYFYILLGLRSAAMAFHLPAMQASIPLLAPEDKLMKIAGVNNIIQSLSSIAGPAMAALLISLLNMTWVLMFDVIGALTACLTLLMVHIPNPEKKSAIRHNVLKELIEGAREIYGKPLLRWMFLFSVAAIFFIMPIAALFPLMTLNHFSGDTYDMSIIEIAWGVGMLAGGAVLGYSQFKNLKIVLINLTYILLGLTFLFSGILPKSGFIYFVIITAFGGLSMSVYSGSFTVLLQTMVEPSALGRVFSLNTSLGLLPSIIGLLATGFIADNIGIGKAFILSGMVITSLGITAFTIPIIFTTIKKRNNESRNLIHSHELN